MRTNKLASKARSFWKDESAVGVVEVILILVDIFVLPFKKKIWGILTRFVENWIGMR